MASLHPCVLSPFQICMNIYTFALTQDNWRALSHSSIYCFYFLQTYQSVQSIKAKPLGRRESTNFRSNIDETCKTFRCPALYYNAVHLEVYWGKFLMFTILMFFLIRVKKCKKCEKSSYFRVFQKIFYTICPIRCKQPCKEVPFIG